jgi:outer membrane cobalamin receptor
MCAFAMRGVVTAGWVAIAAVPGIASAQGAIDEVVVVSKRLEESLPEQLAVSGSRVTTVTAEDIRKGGFNDLGQALQYSVPSLYLAMIGGQFSYADVSLQGSRSGDVLWLVDGVRVNNRLYASTLPLDTLPAHMIERVEVLEGGQGLFYGSQAIAGVINVITKDFTDKTDGAVSLGFDDNEGKHASAWVRGALGDNHLVLYGSVDDGDGYQPFRDRDYQPSATDRNRGYDVKSGGLKYMRDFSDGVRFSASYQHTDADIQLLRAMRVAKNVNSRDEDLISTKLDMTLGEKVDFYVKGYYHDWDTRYTTINNSLTTPGTTVVDSDNLYWGFSDYGVNALMKLKLHKGFEYFLGYDMQKYGGSDEVLLIADNLEKTDAYFAQIRTTEDWVENLHLSAGFRYNAPSDAESATVWTATGKYDISSHLFVRGVVGTGLKLPTAEELYAIDPFELGNPNLKPEKSKNLNLSIGGAVPLGEGSFTWEVVGFFRDITNLISWEFDDVLELDVATNVPGKVKVRGGQLALQGKIASGFTGRLSITRSTSEDAQGQQLVRVPKGFIQAGLDYSAPSGRYGAGLSVNRVGDVYAANFAGNVPYGDYTLVDLGARYFLDEGRHHRLGVRLENAFDEEYGLPGTGRTDVGNVGYTVMAVGTPRTFHVSYSYSF